MEHVKSEDLAVADVPQQKDPEAGADGLHETLEALWRCLDLSEESREYVSLCFTSNRKNEVPLSFQSLLAAGGCQWPGPPGRTAEVPPLPTTDEELILSDQELKEMRMRHFWPQLLSHNDDIIWSNRSIWGPVSQGKLWRGDGMQFQMLGTHRPTGDLHVIIFLCRGGPKDLLWSVYFQSDHLVIYGSQDPKPLGFVGRLTCSGLWCKTWGQNFTSSLGTTSHLQPGNFALLCLCTRGYLNCDPCQLSGISMLGKLSKPCSRSALGCGAVGFGVRQRAHDTGRFRLWFTGVLVNSSG